MKPKTRKEVAKEMVANLAPFSEREKELAELINQAIKKTQVGMKARMMRNEEGTFAVIVTIDLAAPKATPNVPAVQSKEV